MKINLLVLANSSDREAFRVYQETILPFLEHFGVPYIEIDLAKVKEEVNFNAIGILIAQEGIGERISKETKKSLYQAIRQGTGLINLDYQLNFWKELSEPLGIEKIEAESKTSLVRIGEPHYINQLQETEKNLLKPLEYLKVKSKEKPILLAENNSPLFLCSHTHPLPTSRERIKEEGRKNPDTVKLVQFLISPRLWQAEYFGHCSGLDDILLRSIIWAVKKPFVMMAMPPFVTAKIDDANGSANIFGKRKDSANKNFAYIDLFNKYGYIPNIGLYIDDITKNDGKIIKEKYHKKLAEFSPHAFSDPKNVNEFPIYIHHNGEEFSPEEIKENFARVDKKFQHWEINQARTVNAHFAETGLNALPFLKERGQIYFGNSGVRFGKAWVDPEARNWKPKPYGYHGYSFDYMPDDPDFFNVVSHAEPGVKDYITPHFDFLYSCTTFWDESSENDIWKAAERGAEQIKAGLDSGFFGCLVAHEQRIAALNSNEWEKILKNIDKLTSKYNKIYKGYDYIAEYAKSKYNTKIIEANYSSGKIKLKLAGKSTLPLKIYLFNDESCEYEFKETQPFVGESDFIYL